MTSYGIKIETNEKEALNNAISEIPNIDKNNLNWCLLYICGMQYQGDLLRLEREVNNSLYGKKLEWNELEEIINALNDPRDLLILGDNIENRKITMDTEESVIYKSSEYVIELFDSSYYVIYSRNKDYIKSIADECSRHTLIQLSSE